MRRRRAAGRAALPLVVLLLALAPTWRAGRLETPREYSPAAHKPRENSAKIIAHQL
jgi:hypothetical protein